MTDFELHWKPILSYDWNGLGRITNPGKFEGEMLYVPAFWSMSLELNEHCFEITKQDIIDMKLLQTHVSSEYEIMQGFLIALNELKEKRKIKISQTNDGFVCA